MNCPQQWAGCQLTQHKIQTKNVTSFRQELLGTFKYKVPSNDIIYSNKNRLILTWKF